MAEQQTQKPAKPARPLTDQELTQNVFAAEKLFNDALKAARAAGFQSTIQIADAQGSLKTTLFRAH